VLAETRERVEELDNILWTYDPNSFLAHGTDRDEFSADQPIYLTQEDENPNEADIIVLVDERVPSDMSRYKRCLDLFDGRDPSAVEAARGRWKSWKAEGHAVTYWQQKEQGGWEKAG
ncbi:MAG: DNA polymerase III subunit chi, partial [Alphaproteobacteria bacterium]|nr:DNA polymerase III subunit chi [Alphaproteobacteria bacterium]